MARTSTIVRLLMRYGPKSPLGWLGVAVLGVVYLVAQPALNSALGLDLPGLLDNDRSAVSTPSQAASPGGGSVEDITASTQTASAEAPPAAAERTDAPKAETDKKAAPPLGKLTSVGGNVYETTAGLRYAPGSAEGHRLKHVIRHARDDPSRPVHSVFEPGDERAVFAVIDEAYLIADLEGPPRARKIDERGRTVWIVDMRRPVGYVGGQKGKRKGYPKVNGIKLVLDGRNVITAFPDDVR